MFFQYRHCYDCDKRISKKNREYLEGECVCKECFEEASQPNDNHGDCTPIGSWEDLDGIFREHYSCIHVDDDGYTLLDW